MNNNNHAKTIVISIVYIFIFRQNEDLIFMFFFSIATN